MSEDKRSDAPWEPSGDEVFEAFDAAEATEDFASSGCTLTDTRSRALLRAMSARPACRRKCMHACNMRRMGKHACKIMNCSDA